MSHRRLAGQAALALLAAMLMGVGGVAHAKDCAGATPMPADVTITPPAADVSADIARFSGAWGGVWAPRAGGDGPCAVLVVEDVFANGYARVVYSVGASDPVSPQPRAWRASGRVVEGVLRFELPLSWRPELTYRLVGNDLAGTFKDFATDATTTAARIADLRRVACARPSAVGSPARAARDRIVAAELLSPSSRPDGLVHNDYFMPIGTTAPARHALRGILTIHAATISRAHDGCAGLDVPAAGFTTAFFTHGEDLVPAVRTIIRPPGSKAGVILSPGRVWSEPGDQGMSRASFPYVVVDEMSNGTRNGLATFLFDDTRVSNLRVQISQETWEWSRDDFWGQAPLTYAPGPIADEARLRTEFDAERRLETPMKPWSALPASTPSPWLDAFDGDAARDDISANGLIIDGVLYVKACHTRTGPYPYCRHMRHGVFSVTKSLGAAVALLRLAQKYGDGVFDLKIEDYVRVTATHDGWRDVTFADALSMSAPIGDIGPRRDWPQPDPDENKPKFYEWIEARTAREKLDRGFTYGRHPWARGEVVRYNTTVTFTLAAAMDAYLKQKAGPSAHLWDMVVDEVYRPLGIFHEPTMHSLEADGSRGIPLLGYGLTPTIDDVAKLTTLLQQGGRHDGVQLLSGAKLAEALYRTSATGLSVLRRSRYGDYRYHLSFWSVPYVTELGCRFLIPHMAGYGGNLVVLLPNGISAFRFSDGNTYDIETMILAGEAIRPFCTAAPAAQAAPQTPAAPLSAAELRAELPGNTFGAGLVRVFIAPDGRQYVAAGTGVDVGRWRITPEGFYCRVWNVADGGRERCYRVYRDGETFTFNVHDRWTVLRWTRTRGRAAGF
jgi:hypothetical protein